MKQKTNLIPMPDTERDFTDLRNYLNTLTAEGQEAYAQQAGTTIGYLRKALSVKPEMDGKLCRLLEEQSGGRVRKHKLRPDIWPELALAA
jgi:hypothetical protein